MKNMMKKAVLVTAAAAGLAVLGSSASAFAATPDAGDAVQGATHQVTQTLQAKDSSPAGPDAGTTNSDKGGVTPSVEQSVKRWNRGGAALGYGAASLVSSAWVGVPQQVVDTVKGLAGGQNTEVTDHHRG